MNPVGMHSLKQFFSSQEYANIDETKPVWRWGKRGGDNSQSRVFRLLPRLIRWFYGILSGCIYLCDGLGRLRVGFLLCWLILMVVITDYMVQSVSIALRIFNILSESFGSLKLSTYQVGWLALFVGMVFKARYWLFSSE